MSISKPLHVFPQPNVRSLQMERIERNEAGETLVELCFTAASYTTKIQQSRPSDFCIWVISEPINYQE